MRHVQLSVASRRHFMFSVRTRRVASCSVSLCRESMSGFIASTLPLCHAFKSLRLCRKSRVISLCEASRPHAASCPHLVFACDIKFRTYVTSCPNFCSIQVRLFFRCPRRVQPRRGVASYRRSVLCESVSRGSHFNVQIKMICFDSLSGE